MRRRILLAALLICAVVHLAHCAVDPPENNFRVAIEGTDPVKIPSEWAVLRDEYVGELDHPVEVLFAIKHEIHAKKQLEELFWDVSEPQYVLLVSSFT